jgi:hypothetical protein
MRERVISPPTSSELDQGSLILDDTTGAERR